MQVPSVGQGVHWSGHRTSQSLGCFQSVSCAFVPGSRQAALAESQFLHPSHKSRKRSHLPSIRLQLWGYVSSPQSPAGTPEPVTCPLPCVFPAQGVALDMTASLPFLPDSVWIFLQSLACRIAFLPFSSLFSERVTPCVPSMGSWGGGELSFLFCHLHLPPLYLIFFQSCIHVEVPYFFPTIFLYVLFYCILFYN